MHSPITRQLPNERIVSSKHAAATTRPHPKGHARVALSTPLTQGATQLRGEDKPKVNGVYGSSIGHALNIGPSNRAGIGILSAKSWLRTAGIHCRQNTYLKSNFRV